MTLPIKIAGKQYPSITAAALDQGVSISAMQKAYHAGCPELAGKRRDNTRIAVTINGVDYPSALAAQKATGINRNTIASLVHKHGNNLRIYRGAA